jgi:hypothetical protein
MDSNQDDFLVMTDKFPTQADQVPHNTPVPRSESLTSLKAAEGGDGESLQPISAQAAAHQDSASSQQPQLTRSDLDETTTPHQENSHNFESHFGAGDLIMPISRDVAGTEVDARKPHPYQFPPAILNPQKRFDRSSLLPDSDLPLCSQILGYVRCWGPWVAEIEDEVKREKLLDHIFTMATNAWYEALRIGYKAEGPTPRKKTRTTQKRPTVPVEYIPPALQIRGRPKRDADPSKRPVLSAGSHKYGLAWSVTAGELEEAGVSMTRIERRAADKENLKKHGQALLQENLEYYENDLSISQWYGTEKKTELNPWGRDLQIYCKLSSNKNIWQVGQFYHTSPGSLATRSLATSRL